MRLERYIKRKPNKLNIESANLMRNSDFKKQIKNIRKNWNIDIKETKNKKVDNLIDTLLDDINFDKQISSLIKNFNLSQTWRDWLFKFIVHNKSFDSFDPYGNIIVQEINNCVSEFYIKAGPHVTNEDAKRALLVIKTIKGETNVRARKKIYAERDYYIYNLSIKGKSTIEISSLVKKKYRQELDYGHIQKIISEEKIRHQKTYR